MTYTIKKNFIFKDCSLFLICLKSTAILFSILPGLFWILFPEKDIVLFLITESLLLYNIVQQFRYVYVYV